MVTLSCLRPLALLWHSYDRMLSTNGNTAVYLQFAHARLASILRKAEDEGRADLSRLKASAEIAVEHESERGLAFELLMFSDVVQVSCRRPRRIRGQARA